MASALHWAHREHSQPGVGARGGRLVCGVSLLITLKWLLSMGDRFSILKMNVNVKILCVV